VPASEACRCLRAAAPAGLDLVPLCRLYADIALRSARPPLTLSPCDAGYAGISLRSLRTGLQRDGGHLSLYFLQHPLQGHGKLVAGERALAGERSVRIAGEDTALGELLHGIVRPVVLRHVRKRTAAGRRLCVRGTLQQDAGADGRSCTECPFLLHYHSPPLIVEFEPPGSRSAAATGVSTFPPPTASNLQPGMLIYSTVTAGERGTDG
jgi:hypothetical protein